MNDTLSVKALKTDQIGSTQLETTGLSFPRTASPNSDFLRTNLAVNSLSPTTIRVSHQPRKDGTGIQRSLFAVHQKLTRFDAGSNPISDTTFKVAFQTDIPSDVSLAEWRSAVKLLLGALLESDGAMLTAIYQGEY